MKSSGSCQGNVKTSSARSFVVSSRLSTLRQSLDALRYALGGFAGASRYWRDSIVCAFRARPSFQEFEGVAGGWKSWRACVFPYSLNIPCERGRVKRIVSKECQGCGSHFFFFFKALSQRSSHSIGSADPYGRTRYFLPPLAAEVTGRSVFSTRPPFARY